MEHESIIDEDGTVSFLYDDDLVGLARLLGQPVVTRASYVEPDAWGCWLVDMSPLASFSDGPFLYRSDALEAERRYVGQWLRGEPMSKA